MSLDVGDIDVELYEISVKTVIFILEETVSLSLELDHVCVKYLEDGLDVLEVVLLERLKLLFGREEVDKFANSALEEVKTTENLGW